MKENYNIPSADRRKKRAEEEGNLSISHYKGNLHGHTKSVESPDMSPEDIARERGGSNCGKVALDLIVRDHGNGLLNEYLAITEHSRDASPEEALVGITGWFEWLYKERMGEDIRIEDEEEIKRKSKKHAEDVALYGDERLRKILDNIDQLEAGDQQIKIIKGVEANLLPDGSFDTEMVEQGEFELVISSIHPDIDKEGFKDIINDPQKYSDLIAKGAENPKTNIIGHIGYGCEEEFEENLDWDKIFSAALKNDVAIEVNLKELMDFLYKDVFNEEKYNGSEYREVLEQELPNLIPLLSSKKIKDELKKYITKGLKLSINIDEHRNPFAENPSMKRNFRFWRSMKIIEKYFNSIFDEVGIEKENIINTYSGEELDQFLRKEKKS